MKRAIWIMALALVGTGTVQAQEMGTWPEGVVFPVEGGYGLALNSMHLEVEPYVWHCSIVNTVFQVEGWAHITKPMGGDALLALPLMAFNLYESHDEPLYPELEVEGVPVEPQLLINEALFTIDESGVWFEGEQTNWIAHPWLEEAQPMGEVAPELVGRGYELLWIFPVHFPVHQERLVYFSYKHHNSFLGSAGWDRRMRQDLRYARDYSSLGPISMRVAPGSGIAQVEAPGLEVTHSNEEILISGDGLSYLDGVALTFSEAAIIPEELWLRPGDSHQFQGWFLMGAQDWQQLDPAVGQITEAGLYTALGEGEDEVWCSGYWGSSQQVPVHVIDGPPWTPTPSPTVTTTPTPSPPPSGSATPSPTPTAWWPTATPTEPVATPTEPPTDEITYNLYLEGNAPRPGDLFRLWRNAHNYYSIPVEVGEILLLECWGEYFFWPAWSRDFFDFYTWTMAPETGYSLVYMEFEWPADVGPGPDLVFYGGLLDPETLEIYDWDWVTLSWGT